MGRRWLWRVGGLLLAIALAPRAAAQWPFSPAGYLYPKGAADEIDHITLLGKRADCGLEASGVYRKNGPAYPFVDYVAQGTADHSKIRFELETETVAGQRYRFDGQFHNNHVYEEYVTDPGEVVASGKLQKLEAGSVIWEQFVQFTYLPKPRGRLDDVNQPYPSGGTDLVRAAAKADVARMRELLAQGANVDPICPGTPTALQYALAYHADKVEMVRMLVAAGADVNRGGGGGWGTPLTLAADNPAAVELLLAAGAKVNVADTRGATALICAVPRPRDSNPAASRQSVKLLLRAGADVNARDKFGRTPLILARRAGDSETIATLLQAGAEDDEPAGDWKARYTRLLREQIAIVKVGHGAQPPCDMGCLRRLRERAARELGMELPHEYCELLGVADGLYEHWLVIFASRTSRMAGYKEGAGDSLRIEGIVEANLRLWDANPRRRPFLFLGRSDGDDCVFEVGTGKYLRLHPDTLEKRAEASSFEELMAYALDRNLNR